MSIRNSLLRTYFARRMKAIDRFRRHPDQVQAEMFRQLIARGADTKFGRRHGVAKHLTPETQSRYTTNCMIKHLGEPIDIAYMALYLASDESKYVTAHVMNVSGGWM